ncbi:GNAT family N-acetyltransferase [Sphingomonas sp.]|uniref:GNAT family N-acetyltransferase n=1 Tax=Sphingomonas sp. TaxID=28214 RepID=UPI001AFCDDC1|nr:GNAT family N-acetyltransferase [Sphingomonas sp.]MBO9711573.1 GNAT family N-acetyltransferase [Sphingomonas sp.]
MIELRPEVEADEPFLRHLFTAVRSPEFAMLGLPPAQLETMLGMQFNAQRMQYRGSYPEAEWHIVERGGEAVGRFCVVREPEGWLVVDVAVLPGAQGQGIGGALLDGLIERAEAEGSDVRLQVRPENPARRLYARKGFVETGMDGIDVAMRRPAKVS